MSNQALFLFVILLLSLGLCCFLGGSNCSREGYTSGSTEGKKGGKVSHATGSKGNTVYHAKGPEGKSKTGVVNNSGDNYDNYNHYSGSSTKNLVNGTMFYGPNGATAEYIVASNGTATIKLVQTSGSSYIIFNSKSTSKSTSSTTTFYGPSGFTATIHYGKNGAVVIFTLPNGATQTFTQQSYTANMNSTQYYGSTGDRYSAETGLYDSPYASASAGYVSGPNGNSAYYAKGPNGNYYAGTNYNGPNNYSNGSNNYSSSLPNGIPASQIPPGQEDLYILKSEIVPPVCPACPSSSACPSTKKETCPPCPACARCPEQPFECKKVPNYEAISDEYLPEPVLNSFATF